MEKYVLFIETERKLLTLRDEVDRFIIKLKEEISVRKCTNEVHITSLYVTDSTEDDTHGNVISITHNLQDKDPLGLLDSHEPSSPSNFPHDDKDNIFKYNDFFMLADEIHKYADGLGDLGSYQLYIVLCIDSYAPDISEIAEFYGALRRLQVWHTGALFISTKNPEVVSDWPALIPLEIIPSSTEIMLDILDTLWRGTISLSVKESKEPYVFPECALKCVYGIPALGCDSKQEKVYMLPSVEVVSQVDIGTVPWVYLKFGGVYDLTAARHTDIQDQEEVTEMIQMMTSTPGIGTIIRLQYSSTAPVIDGVRDVTTEEWKRCLGEGQFDCVPNLVFKSYHTSLSFLILTEGANGKRAHVVALQDPSVCGEDVVKLAMKELSKPVSTVNLAEKEKVEKLLGDTPCLKSLHMEALSHLSLNLPKQLCQRLERAGQDISKLWEETRCDLEASASAELFRHLMMKPGSPLEVLSCNNDKFIPETDLPINLWPEYIALVEADADHTSLKRNSSSDLLGGLAPPPRPDTVMTLDAAQFTQLFTKSGQPTDRIRSKMNKHVAVGNKFPFKPTMTLQEVKSLNWQESLHTHHHGLHYNVDERSEKFEDRCNRMRDRYIRKEWASTCSTFQDKETFVAVTSATTYNTRGTEKNASTSSKIIGGSTRQGETCHNLDMDNSSIASSRSALPGRRQSTRLSQGPTDTSLRRSPRKRTSTSNSHLEMKPSDLLRPVADSKSVRRSTIIATHNKKAPVPASLSDVHKTKLRIAVVTALEREGIKMKNQLFKVCFKKLFEVCRPFALDVVGCGSTSRSLEKIAKSHVKQVIDFEMIKLKKRHR